MCNLRQPILDLSTIYDGLHTLLASCHGILDFLFHVLLSSLHPMHPSSSSSFFSVCWACLFVVNALTKGPLSCRTAELCGGLEYVWLGQNITADNWENIPSQQFNYLRSYVGTCWLVWFIIVRTCRCAQNIERSWQFTSSIRRNCRNWGNPSTNAFWKSLRSIPFSLGGRLRQPRIKMGIFSGPTTLKGADQVF